jgi:hypothetical protein
MNASKKKEYEETQDMIYIFSDNTYKTTICRSIYSAGFDLMTHKLPFLKWEAMYIVLFLKR